jgi:trehalose 6-phosphate phosphatase
VTDFDGTLSPIVDVPSSARPLDGVPAVLARLADRFATVAVVSGRPVSFLWAHLGHVATAASGRLLLIGLYGMESAAPDGTVVLDDAAAAWVPAIVEVADRLRSDAPDGVLVEVAGPSVTVHWRLAPEAGDWVRERSAAEAAATGLGAHPGRRSVELRPPLAIDKGTVVRRLADGRRAVGFLGDDLGDLPAFAELARLRAAGGTATVGVAVVDQETSPEVAASADLSVQGPEGALAVLAWLAAAPVTGADR